jgi:hypothetical protein
MYSILGQLNIIIIFTKDEPKQKTKAIIASNPIQLVIQRAMQAVSTSEMAGWSRKQTTHFL